MKLILAGTTGFVGQEVLHQCLKNPSITSLVALSRRELPESVTSNSKLKVIILNDFTSYPDTVLQELAGAESCIWSLGLRAGQSPNSESGRRIDIDYTLAAANAFATSLAPKLGDGRKFRFVYCSGIMAVRDQEKPLWFMQEPRRIRGEVENKLVELGKLHPDAIETFIVRPGAILSKENKLPVMIVRLSRSIRVDELSAVMVNTALHGTETQIMEVGALQTEGSTLLKSSG
ncbi:hypothetical protein MMC24_006816 [Lignoscripta atroalba]|nr:hypothetical protein [Lignoscripta atroalba]